MNHIPWLIRSTLNQSTRKFFQNHNYTEVETPIGVMAPGTEPYLRYFATNWTDAHLKTHSMFLRSSPELHMKRILSEELPAIFQIAPCFRNVGELSDWHHPEFRMIEWYSCLHDLEGFLGQLNDYLQTTLDDYTDFLSRSDWKESGLSKPLALLQKPHVFSMYEAFQEFAGIELIDGDPDLARKALEKKVPSVFASDSFETAYFKIQLDVVEPALKELNYCLICGYPPSQAVLSKVVEGRAQRFEVYVEGIELANGFVELTDPGENRLRIEAANKVREREGFTTVPIDLKFLDSLESLPNCIGVALGLDRWFALATGERNIQAVIPFHDDVPYSSSLDR